jgi:hypothetical protein
MEIYQDLIDRNMAGSFNPQVLNMLNTKYVVFPGQKGSFPLPNAEACGNAWFVNEIKWAATADEEMASLRSDSELSAQALFGNLRGAMMAGQDTVPKLPTSGGFKPKETAIVRATFKNELGSYTFGKGDGAYVKLAEYGLDDISFTSHNSKDGFAVFSDIYYPKGWKAYVDGKETPIVRANYVLRALKVPQGDHKIEFRFRPESFYNGKKVAVASSVLLILLCLGALYPLFKKQTPNA